MAKKPFKGLPQKIKDRLKEHEKDQRDGRKYADRILKKIKTFDTDTQAQILARICVRLDEEYGTGTHLAIDWTLDHYIGYEFEKNVSPMLEKIWVGLRNSGFTVRNKFEYFKDAEAFYIPHPELKICVFGRTYRDTPRYLVIDYTHGGEFVHFRKVYVRNIWDRTRKNCIDHVEQPTLSYYRKLNFQLRGAGHPIYGDTRDPGHIMTYDVMFDGHGKCDNVLGDPAAPLQWFFECNSLWSQLNEDVNLIRPLS